MICPHDEPRIFCNGRCAECMEDEIELLRAGLEKLRPFIEEIWAQHRDPYYENEYLYNECEKSECMWCSSTREALRGNL